MNEIMKYLNEIWDEHSLIFIFFTALIGGLVGGMTKLYFEFLIPERYKINKEAKVIYERYSAPLARSINLLVGRLDNLIFMYKYQWFDKSEYYRLSTLYVFCQYFGWVEILLNELSLLHYESVNKNKQFSIFLNNVEKSFNNRIYFSDLSYNNIPDDSELPKFICKAIGELSIVKNENQELSTLSFIDFFRKYHNDREFHAWLSILEKFIMNISKEDESFSRDRIILIRLSLGALLKFLDKKNVISKELSNKRVNDLLSKIESKNAKHVFLIDIVKKDLPIKIDFYLKFKLKIKKLLRMNKKPIPFTCQPNHN